MRFNETGPNRKVMMPRTSPDVVLKRADVGFSPMPANVAFTPGPPMMQSPGFQPQLYPSNKQAKLSLDLGL